MKPISTEGLGEAPEWGTFEKFPKNRSILEYKALGAAEKESLKQDERKVPLYPIAWGWNADGRAGNATMVEIRKPQMVHKSTMRDYISCSAGVHHSLFVSTDGIVYSFGSGRRGQLGYFPREYKDQRQGKDSTVTGQKGGIQQTLPRAVIGTGTLVFGTDVKIGQACAGRFSSVARQINRDEGIAAIKTLMDTKHNLEFQMSIYPESLDIQRAWASVRQEIFKVQMISNGQLTAWGKGDFGELGLGPYELLQPSPQVIPKLRNTVITQIAMGRHHVLAIDHDKKLYSWGSGAFGKLGQGDFYNRYSPTSVDFFLRYNVEYIAAGDHHSACLTTTRKSEGTKKVSQLRRVSCWGKGAHGRLGYGRNLLRKVPTLVDDWPPSMNGCQFQAIACGGAHTVVLGYQLVDKCLVYPRGVRTYLASWGYGGNGQLGNGYVEDSFVPIRTRFQAKNVCFVEVAAGRSWTMARTFDGKLYTWGKGLRGQLGQGKAKFSLVPRKVPTFTAFLKIDSGFGHSTCLSTSKKIFRSLVEESKSEGSGVFEPLTSLTLKKKESESLYQFDCCKGTLPWIQAKVRYICKTCNMHSVCLVCRQICHAGHDVVERLDMDEEEYLKKQKKKKKLKAQKKAKVPIKGKKKDQEKSKRDKKLSHIALRKMLKASGKTLEDHVDLMEVKMMYSGKDYKKKIEHLARRKMPYCCCGVSNPCCRRLASLTEEETILLDEEGDNRLDLIVPKIEPVKGRKAPDLMSFPYPYRIHQAAMRIQRQAQWYINRRHLKKVKDRIMFIRHEACVLHWDENIIKPIFEKLDRAKGRFREKREQQEMFIEDIVKHKYDYSRDLQSAVGAANSVMFGMEKVIGGLSLQLPSFKHGRLRKKVPLYSSFSWTVTGLRAQQLKLHESERISRRMFVDLTRGLPRESRHDGKFKADPDLFLFFERFMQDISTRKWRDHFNWTVAEKKRIREEAVAAARKILMKQRFGAAMAIKQAEELERQQAAGPGGIKAKPPPGPPPGPPPEEQKKEEYDSDEEDDENRKDEESVGSGEEWQHDQEEISRPVTSQSEVDKQKKEQEAPFDIYGEVKQTHTLIRRRNSIDNAEDMYDRIVTHAKDKILVSTSIRRRNSLPANMKDLSVPEVPTRESQVGVLESLDVFALRLKFCSDYIEANHVWESMEERVRNKRLKRVLGYSWFNPRLPLEMRRILTNGGRRRTIGEPERLAKQSHMMLEQRNYAIRCRDKAKSKQKYTRRRRSFDFGEWNDETDGILDMLGYPHDPPTLQKLPTVSNMRRDAGIMENRMIFAGVLKLEEKKKVEGPDFSGFEALDVVKNRLKEEEAANMMKEGDEEKGMDASPQSKQRAIKPGAGNWAAAKKPKGRHSHEQKPHAPSEPPGAVIWQEYFSEDGETYYYNPDTQESRWEYPTGDDMQVVSQYQDDEGFYYWYNFVTGESTWA